MNFCWPFAKGWHFTTPAQLDQAVSHDPNSQAGKLAGKRLCARQQTTETMSTNVPIHALYTEMLSGSADVIATQANNQLENPCRISPSELAASILCLAHLTAVRRC